MRSGQTIKGPVIEVVEGPDPRHRPARVPARVARGSAARPRSAAVRRPGARERRSSSSTGTATTSSCRGSAFLEESQSEGRKKFLENLKKGPRSQGHGQLDRELRGVRGPRRRRRARPRLGAVVEARGPSPGRSSTVGQEVEVEVLDVDLERERVSLSLKATQEDPWKEFERTSKAGSVIDGTVHEARAVRRVRTGRAGDRGPRAHLRDQQRARRLAGIGADESARRSRSR